VDLEKFAAWLADTPFSIQLHESLYSYTIIESIHVIAITLFVGTIAMVDLRLLGLAFKGTPVSQMNARVLPWTVAGFAVMIVTGLLLFYAIPVRTYHSVWFRTKMILLVVAAINIWLFHTRVERNREKWDTAPVAPLGARISAGVSLFVWTFVIVFGRFIAYNWFDCDKPQPAWVMWYAQCPAPHGM
jgi:uncharacterized membrane protein SirB2